MNSVSILYLSGAHPIQDSPPAYFADLGLDKIVDAVTAGYEAYRLKPLFFSPPSAFDDVLYRQQVMQELEDASLLHDILLFSAAMHTMREQLQCADSLRDEWQKKRWRLEACHSYCQGVLQLHRVLQQAPLRSAGLQAFRAALAEFVHSAHFTSQAQAASEWLEKLARIRYTLQISGSVVTVRRAAGEADYSAMLTDTFSPFREQSARPYLVDFETTPAMSGVESEVLRGVARLYQSDFAAMDDFLSQYQEFPHPLIGEFDREIQFYAAYLKFTAPFSQAGLSFCYPSFSQNKEVQVFDAYDLALAHQLLPGGGQVVCNDFRLQGAERILVVTGANQGGKTTLARTFGQVHFLARLGCPVAGSSAQVFFFDQLFTHFERAEMGHNLRGKLQDDLIRMRDILDRATGNSMVIMNEIFTSTSLQDALLLGRQILLRLCQLDTLSVCVTFLDELSSLGPQTVSMVATVAPDDPSLRTFKVVRQTANGLSHALSLAKKHALTHAQLMERLAR